MIPLVVGPATVAVRAEAVELTGVAVRLEEVTAAGLTPAGIQET